VDGLRVARRTPFALGLFVIVAMVELTYGAQTVQLVVYAARSLGLGGQGYGQLLAATGAGGVLSALVNGRLASSNRVSVIVGVAALLACATQLVFAASDVVVLALAVAVIGGAGLVSCEVVAETALARIAPREALGRMIGVYDASSVAAMIAGAVLAPALIAATSLRTSLLVLGAAAVLVSLLAYVALRGVDALSAQHAAALGSRIELLAGLPVTVGVPRLVLEQLAHAAQLCPLPAGVDVVVQGAPAHAFYAVADGRVVVHRDGRAVVHLGRGDAFGERGLLDNAPRNATVTTEVPTTLLRVEGSALLDALESAPGMRRALDLVSTAPGVEVPATETELVDDRRWVKA
jgi:CRP-like cAMP-binding protein